MSDNVSACERVLAGGAHLIEADLLGEASRADSVKKTQRAEAVDVGGVLRHFEGHLDVTLRAEVVHLIGVALLQNVDEVGGVRQVAVVQEEARLAAVLVFVEVLDAAGVERARAANDAVHVVAATESCGRRASARARPPSAHPLLRSSSARYEPSCPVMPVSRATLCPVPPATCAFDLPSSAIVVSVCAHADLTTGGQTEERVQDFR